MDSSKRTDLEPRLSLGFPAAAIILVLGILAKVIILEAGGSVLLASGILILANLAAAVILEYTSQMHGLALGAIGILMASVLLPLLWVEDRVAWLRENPLNGGIVIIAAAYALQKNRVRRAILAVAIILAVAQLGISFL